MSFEIICEHCQKPATKVFRKQYRKPQASIRRKYRRRRRIRVAAAKTILRQLNVLPAPTPRSHTRSAIREHKHNQKHEAFLEAKRLFDVWCALLGQDQNIDGRSVIWRGGGHLENICKHISEILALRGQYINHWVINDWRSKKWMAPRITQQFVRYKQKRTSKDKERRRLYSHQNREHINAYKRAASLRDNAILAAVKTLTEMEQSNVDA